MLRPKVRESVDVLADLAVGVRFAAAAELSLKRRIIGIVRPRNEFLVTAAAAVLKDRDLKMRSVRRHLSDVGFYDRHLHLKKNIRGAHYRDLAVGRAVNLFAAELGK